MIHRFGRPELAELARMCRVSHSLFSLHSARSFLRAFWGHRCSSKCSEQCRRVGLHGAHMVFEMGQTVNIHIGEDAQLEETRRAEGQGMGELFSLVVTMLRKEHLMREKEQCGFVGKECLGKRKLAHKPRATGVFGG